jgi:thioredoxin reductase/NAD-dependent dihydropyrimidine dehydrogenase PreA subunit
VTLDRLVIVVPLMVASLAGLAMLWLRRAMGRAHAALLEKAKAEGRGVAESLYPVVDPDRCIASLSCLSSCPEGNVLGIVNGTAALVDPAACVGHGLCALECPTGAISLVLGSRDRGVDLPVLDGALQTNRAGVYIAGELGGARLIRGAIVQGLSVADRLVSRAVPGERVLIVGAGPAGLAAALVLKERGIEARVLERDSGVGGAVANYPRKKMVTTERFALPYMETLSQSRLPKEALLAAWTSAVAKAGLTIETGVQVERIEGQDGQFRVITSRGPVEASKVVLAIGRQGTPRRLEAPGADAPKVAYRLIDAQDYQGRRVLVVGGGDSALEAAIQLAEESNAEVALSYRQEKLSRAREANRRRFWALVEQRRIAAHVPSKVTGVDEGQVTLEGPGGELVLPNDAVIACLGGDAPERFLKENGLGMRRLHGEPLDAEAGLAAGRTSTRGRVVRAGLLIFSVLTAVGLGWLGRDYYELSRVDRLAHTAHTMLKPAGSVGHALGIVAGALMVLSLVYSLRKRWRRLKGGHHIRPWLTFHEFAGFLSAVLAIFHAAFQSNNEVATITSLALFVVVLTGLVGRFLWELVPGAMGLGADEERSGHLELLGRLTEAEVERAQGALIARGSRSGGRWLPAVLRGPGPRPEDGPEDGEEDDGEELGEEAVLTGLGPPVSLGQALEELRASGRLLLLRAQLLGFGAARWAMASWRVLHIGAAFLVLLLVAAHVVLSLYLGFSWVDR